MSESTPKSAAGNIRFVTVQEDDSGQRLDNFLLRELKGLPRGRLYRALRKGEVRVNKGRVRADYRLVAGDSVRIPPLRLPEPREQGEIPLWRVSDLEQRVIFEDEGLLALDKPSGLAVHGGSGLNFGLIECLREMRPSVRYLELVHRLDRDTSGLILVAKRPAVLRDLHLQLREKRVEKRYLALVAGYWPAHLGSVDAPLLKNVLQSGERIVRVSAEGKPAVTQFRVQERLAGATLLAVTPVTGRTHQIRVHAQHAGFPLLGDDKYSDDRTMALARELGLRRLFLHASKLRLSHAGEARFELECPLDPDLEIILEKARNS